MIFNGCIATMSVVEIGYSVRASVNVARYTEGG